MSSISNTQDFWVLFINIVDIKLFNKENDFAVRNIFFDEKPKIQTDFKISIWVSDHRWVHFFTACALKLSKE